MAPSSLEALSKRENIGSVGHLIKRYSYFLRKVYFFLTNSKISFPQDRRF